MSYLQVYSLVMLAMNVDVYAAIKWPIWHRLNVRKTLELWIVILGTIFVGSVLFFTALPFIFDGVEDKKTAGTGDGARSWLGSAAASVVYVYYPAAIHVCIPTEYLRFWKLHLTVKSGICIPAAGVTLLTVLIVRELRHAQRYDIIS